MKTIKIGLNGAFGKMGKAVEALIDNELGGYELVSKVGSTCTQQQMDEACKLCDVMIDFSSPNSIEAVTDAVGRNNSCLIVGTTGLKSKHIEFLKSLATKTAVLYSANTSVGANLIADLSARAATVLNQYDVEIVEAHHRFKKDAPSGTALMIGKKIADVKGIDFEKNAVFDRAAKGAREYNEMSFSSIRGGGIFGECEVIFAGQYEVVSISCRALSRDSFAEGALVAAKWLVNQKPGLYSMKDVLGLNAL
jgi:4-hydroxy-tetrahydrodipicolinate reductase